MANNTTKSSSTSKKKKSSSTTSYRKKTNNSIASSLSNASGIDKKIIAKGISKTNKLSLGSKFAIVLCLLIGVVAGYFGVTLIQKNDQFRLINGESFSMNVSETYDTNDLSKYVICVSYSRNVISSVSVEIKDESGKKVDTIDSSKEGIYTLTFKSSDFKYSKITLNQTLTIVNAEDSYIND